MLGQLTIHLHLPACSSLKEKRGRLKPLLARLHKEFNVSVAEMDLQDKWTEAILAWVAEALGPETYVNLMDQYRPAGRVGSGNYPEIDRPLSRAEYQDALFAARRAGLRRLDGYRQS